MYKSVVLSFTLVFSVFARGHIERLQLIDTSITTSDWGCIFDDFVGYYEIHIEMDPEFTVVTLHEVTKNVSVNIRRDTLVACYADGGQNPAYYISELGCLYVVDGKVYCSLFYRSSKMDLGLKRDFWKHSEERINRSKEWDGILEKKISGQGTDEETGYGYFERIR
jgi:hypothetical protein